MPETLHTFVRRRAAQQGLPLTTLCKRAGISRDTLYALERDPRKLPTLSTVVALAGALEVHPMWLLQCLFDLLPTKPEVCRAVAGDRSAFVDDVTYPDGSVVGLKQRFEKIWALQNVGTVPWRGRSLVCVDDEVLLYSVHSGQLLISPGLKPDLDQLPLPEVLPGAVVQAAMWFTAPAQPCTVVSYWKMADADRALCFPGSAGLWLMVKVVGIGAAAIPASAPAQPKTL